MIPTNEKNAKGTVLMVLSMLAFALADTCVKLAAMDLSPAQVLSFLMSGGLVSFALMAKIKGERLADRRAFSPLLIIRYIAEIAGMIGMVLALAYVPISTVGAITQATPILVALGAVFFLKERISWRRWTSIGLGFLGVLMIVQPGTVSFDLSVLWALLALFALSIRDLTTRMVPDNMPSSSLATYTMIAALPFAIVWVLYNGESLLPPNVNWLIILPMILLGSTGYLMLIASLRMAEVSVVMPYRYSRIVFLLLVGILIFDERPNAVMLLGAAIIVISGIYMMWRERQVRLSHSS